VGKDAVSGTAKAIPGEPERPTPLHLGTAGVAFRWDQYPKRELVPLHPRRHLDAFGLLLGQALFEDQKSVGGEGDQLAIQKVPRDTGRWDPPSWLGGKPRASLSRSQCGHRGGVVAT
jgi:hypothetical protein